MWVEIEKENIKEYPVGTRVLVDWCGEVVDTVITAHYGDADEGFDTRDVVDGGNVFPSTGWNHPDITVYVYANDLTLFKEVAEVIGEKRAEIELTKVQQEGLDVLFGSSVTAAFIWALTPQGVDFWQSVASGVDPNPAEKDSDNSMFYQALGWAHSYFCTMLDESEDPRQVEVGEFVEKAEKDFGLVEPSDRDNLIEIVGDVQFSDTLIEDIVDSVLEYYEEREGV